MKTINKKLFQDTGADAVIITSPSNLFYFTGYQNADACLLLLPDKAYYISDDRVREEFAALRPDIAFARADKNDYLGGALRFLNEIKAEQVGFENTSILYSEYTVLSAGDYALIPYSGVIAGLRAQKSPKELALIKKSQAATDGVFSTVIGRLFEGMTEKELRAVIDSEIILAGGSPPFETIVAFGENTSRPHAHPSDRKLKFGDPITIDFGAKIDGYCSDMTRSFAFGAASDEYLRIWDMVAEAQRAGFNAVRAGVIGADVHGAAANYFERFGLKENFVHSLGHSLGVDIHEKPLFSPRYTGIIPEGAVMSVEPGLYFGGKFGVRTEDIVSVQNSCAENLTNSPKLRII